MGGWLIDQVWEFRLARKEHTVEVVFEDNPGGLPALTHTQLETINLACQQHELRLPLTGARAAFFMGDGPGVMSARGPCNTKKLWEN